MSNVIKLKVDNSSAMRSFESAHIKITSPTKNSIYLLKKYAFKDSTPQELIDVFWKFCGDPTTRFVGEKDATIEEMHLLLKYSKL